MQASDPNDTRPFPVQGGSPRHEKPPCSIPWWLAEVAYKGYGLMYPCSAKQQSLERLKERGGFGREELLVYIARAMKEVDEV